MRFGTLSRLAAGAHGFLLQPSSPARTLFKHDQLAFGISPLPRVQSCSTASRAASSENMSTVSASRRLGKLVPSNTVFFLCDIQERFRDLIFNMPAVISTAKFMVDVSQELEVPCIVTEQYPERLLPTVAELNIKKSEKPANVDLFSKKLFSMCTSEVMDTVKRREPRTEHVVLFGIEAHVCVTQTCLDLLEHDYKVHVVCDGVSSQKPYDRTVALQRMQQAGAYLTTAEQVTFQLLNNAEDPKFKAVSNLVKIRNTEGINTFSTMSTL
ncbi:unnamed protein product [Scytosiphon promiscuus]